jgi:uncharacterized membrane protein
MSQPQRDPQEQQIEQVMGNLLRSGVILAALLVVVGGVIFLARHGWETADYRDFRATPDEYRHPSQIVRRARGLSGRAIIQLGLLVLIATPVARVLFSAVAFAWERDFTYVVLTLIVLGVLLYSLLAPNPV